MQMFLTWERGQFKEDEGEEHGTEKNQKKETTTEDSTATGGTRTIPDEHATGSSGSMDLATAKLQISEEDAEELYQASLQQVSFQRADGSWKPAWPPKESEPRKLEPHAPYEERVATGAAIRAAAMPEKQTAHSKGEGKTKTTPDPGCHDRHTDRRESLLCDMRESF
jgi:hypothetical protein